MSAARPRRLARLRRATLTSAGLAAALLLAGCTDSLGVGTDCDAEMRVVRLREGLPYSTQRGSEGGRRVERWYYESTAGRYYYEFAWGGSDEECVVRGPIRFARLPAG